MMVVLSIALPEFCNVAIDSTVTYHWEGQRPIRKTENKIYALGNCYAAAWGELLGGRRALIEAAKKQAGDRPEAVSSFLLDHVERVERPRERVPDT